MSKNDHLVHPAADVKSTAIISVSVLLRNSTITIHIVNWLSSSQEKTTVVTDELGTTLADTLTAVSTYFDNGTLPEAPESLSSFRRVPEGDVTRYALQKKEPLQTEQEGFIRAIKTGDTSGIVTLNGDLNVIEISVKIVANCFKPRLRCEAFPRSIISLQSYLTMLGFDFR